MKKLETQIVNTKDVVSNIMDMVRVTANDKGGNLKYDSENTDLKWYIRADALRLKQIFINLISHDVIYVRDTGVGMSEEFLKKRIFKPFSQESNAVSTIYADSGLGLSIAKSLVELMNERIEVESELGVGTTFAVYLDFERVDEIEAKMELSKQKNENENMSISTDDKKHDEICKIMSNNNEKLVEI